MSNRPIPVRLPRETIEQLDSISREQYDLLLTLECSLERLKASGVDAEICDRLKDEITNLTPNRSAVIRKAIERYLGS